MANPDPTQPCAIDGCDNYAKTRGWCAKHYWRWSHHGDPHKTIKPPPAERCEAPNCPRPLRRGRYCATHEGRRQRYGTLDLPPRADRHRHSHGYVIVKRTDHPLTRSTKQGAWLYEHRVVLFDKIGPGAHPCHWCGTAVSWDRSYPTHADGLVSDHLDRDKANNDPDNLVPSCALCNLQRNPRWPDRTESA